jgi:hypothetical protein
MARMHLRERAVVVQALHALLETRAEEIENGFDANRLLAAIDIWSEDGGAQAAN